mmetsp:Transcript_84411/g.149317  ORF Transcript_84411/g.149317 Transcript_84411/m.149317 type:complete len:484 (+) Transcript_84411:81-1532(+)
MAATSSATSYGSDWRRDADTLTSRMVQLESRLGRLEEAMLESRVGALEYEVRRLIALSSRGVPDDDGSPGSIPSNLQSLESYAESADPSAWAALERVAVPTVPEGDVLPELHEPPRTPTSADHGNLSPRALAGHRESRLSIASVATTQEFVMEETSAESKVSELDKSNATLEPQAVTVATSELASPQRRQDGLLVGSVSSLVSDATIAPDASQMPPPGRPGGPQVSGQPAPCILKTSVQATSPSGQPNGSTPDRRKIAAGAATKPSAAGWSCISLAPAMSTASASTAGVLQRTVSPAKSRAPGSVVVMQPLSRMSPQRQRSAPSNAVTGLPLSGRLTSPVVFQTASASPSPNPVTMQLHRTMPHGHSRAQSPTSDQAFMPPPRTAAPQQGQPTQIQWAQPGSNTHGACLAHTPSPTPPQPGPPPGSGGAQLASPQQSGQATIGTFSSLWGTPCQAGASGALTPLPPGHCARTVAASPMRPSRV